MWTYVLKTVFFCKSKELTSPAKFYPFIWLRESSAQLGIENFFSIFSEHFPEYLELSKCYFRKIFIRFQSLLDLLLWRKDFDLHSESLNDILLCRKTILHLITSNSNITQSTFVQRPQIAHYHLDLGWNCVGLIYSFVKKNKHWNPKLLINLQFLMKFAREALPH